MPDYLSSIPAAYAFASPGFVETLIQSRREELFTGLMRLYYPTGETFIFTFWAGVPQKLYRCLEKSTEVLPRRSWAVALDLPDASVSFLQMSVESLRLMSIACEAPVSLVKEWRLSPQSMVEWVGKWSRHSEPCILHVRANYANRIYLISGISNPVIEELFFSGDDARFSVNDASFPGSLPPAEYLVTHYTSTKEHVAWNDYDLRLAFNPLIRILLSRFSELAGRMLTERLCEQLSLWLQHQGLNIKVSANGVVNHHYFERIEDSVNAYVGIVNCFHEEASPAVGLRMAEGISREALLKLDPYRRDVLMRYVYNENRLTAGRVWR